MSPAKKKSSSKKGKKKRVFVVDDHSIVRQGIIQLINQEDDFEVCGEAEDAHQAMDGVRETKPDVVLVDLTLKDTSGLELIKNFKSLYEEMPMLVLSMHDESLYAERVLRAGARGYIMKQEATENVMVAMRQVLGGQVYVSPNIASKILHALVDGPGKGGGSPLDRLSDRELEVFQMIGRGISTREIAEKLFLSIKTVETYRAHIKEKLNLKNATELVQRAVQWVQSENSV